MKPKTSPISLRPMKPGEEAGIVDLVLEVFSEFVAPEFPDEGISEFKRYITASALSERFASGNPILVALLETKLIGVTEIRDHCHIALLFVKPLYQKKGLARQLIHEAVRICKKRNPDIQKMTVNSSPNAYEAYRRLGFTGERKVKTVNAIRFIPMELRLGPKS